MGLLAAMAALTTAFNTQDYPNSQQINPQYTVYWRINNDEIQLGLDVLTTGWIGFGIGEPTSGR